MQERGWGETGRFEGGEGRQKRGGRDGERGEGVLRSAEYFWNRMA